MFGIWNRVRRNKSFANLCRYRVQHVLCIHRDGAIPPSHCPDCGSWVYMARILALYNLIYIHTYILIEKCVRSIEGPLPMPPIICTYMMMAYKKLACITLCVAVWWTRTNTYSNEVHIRLCISETNEMFNIRSSSFAFNMQNSLTCPSFQVTN